MNNGREGGGKGRMEKLMENEGEGLREDGVC